MDGGFDKEKKNRWVIRSCVVVVLVGAVVMDGGFNCWCCLLWCWVVGRE